MSCYKPKYCDHELNAKIDADCKKRRDLKLQMEVTLATAKLQLEVMSDMLTPLRMVEVSSTHQEPKEPPVILDATVNTLEA